MADTQVKTQDPAEETKELTKMKTKPLSATEQADVEKTFAEARDFRSLGEKITAPIASIIAETATVIDNVGAKEYVGAVSGRGSR